jgi:hypothetical protein
MSQAVGNAELASHFYIFCSTANWYSSLREGHFHHNNTDIQGVVHNLLPLPTPNPQHQQK